MSCASFPDTKYDKLICPSMVVLRKVILEGGEPVFSSVILSCASFPDTKYDKLICPSMAVLRKVILEGGESVSSSVILSCASFPDTKYDKLSCPSMVVLRKVRTPKLCRDHGGCDHMRSLGEGFGKRYLQTSALSSSWRTTLCDTSKHTRPSIM